MEKPKSSWIDISSGICAATPVWPGDPSPIITAVATHAAGDGYQLSEAFFGLHTGTHIDAPLHFIPDGKGIDELDLNKLIGAVRVLDATGCELIDAVWLLEKDIQPGERLLFKTFTVTGKRVIDYTDHFTALDGTGARFLAEKKIHLAGIDGLSIAINQQLQEVHICLLKEEIVILENLNLNAISEGHYEMICLPVKIEGAEAAPARVLVRQV